MLLFFRLCIAALAVGLSGCATYQPWKNYETKQLSEAEIEQIVTDLSAQILSRYAPGQTIFVFEHKLGPLGKVLEATLRSAGYGVLLSAKPTEKYAQPREVKRHRRISYVVTLFENTYTYRSGIKVESGTGYWGIDRMYTRDEKGVLMAGLTVTQREASEE